MIIKKKKNGKGIGIKPEIFTVLLFSFRLITEQSLESISCFFVSGPQNMSISIHGYSDTGMTGTFQI